MRASHIFESIQGSFPYFFVTNSTSYSPEDLFSNLVGFIRAYTGYDHTQMREICGEVSLEDTYRLRDENFGDDFGALKRMDFTPAKIANVRINGHVVDSATPTLFQQFVPEPEGTNWRRLDIPHISSFMRGDGEKLSVNRAGKLVARD